MELTKLRFDQAMLLLLHGVGVQREEWNISGHYLSYYKGNPDGPNTVRETFLIDGEKKEGNVLPIHWPVMTMSHPKDGVFPGWTPSQQDMFADDWRVVFKEEESRARELLYGKYDKLKEALRKAKFDLEAEKQKKLQPLGDLHPNSEHNRGQFMDLSPVEIDLNQAADLLKALRPGYSEYVPPTVEDLNDEEHEIYLNSKYEGDISDIIVELYQASESQGYLVTGDIETKIGIVDDKVVLLASASIEPNDMLQCIAIFSGCPIAEGLTIMRILED